LQISKAHPIVLFGQLLTLASRKRSLRVCARGAGDGPKEKVAAWEAFYIGPSGVTVVLTAPLSCQRSKAALEQAAQVTDLAVLTLPLSPVWQFPAASCISDTPS
jgi:hypothetical protein